MKLIKLFLKDWQNPQTFRVACNVVQETNWQAVDTIGIIKSTDRYTVDESDAAAPLICRQLPTPIPAALRPESLFPALANNQPRLIPVISCLAPTKKPELAKPRMSLPVPVAKSDIAIP